MQKKDHKKIIIIQANYYQDISQMLLDGAVAEIKSHNFEIINVPGAFEIPSAINMIHNSDQNNEIAGYIALGCVIRGETSHYDYVCSESARGINKLAIKYQLPIGNGIITVENKDQAKVRADINQRNKGGFAARACLDMIKLKEKYDKK